MPEYLAPGVYVEEVSFRSESIEGVSTSTAGFVGPTRYGPVGGVPELLTSFADFDRIYGGIDLLAFGAADNVTTAMPNFMAHAVRSFFDNGGARLYVTRIFEPRSNTDGGHATAPLGTGGGVVSPERFTHGSSAQRVTWLKRGLESGSVDACDTFGTK